jgi:hypothetical protein
MILHLIVQPLEFRSPNWTILRCYLIQWKVVEKYYNFRDILFIFLPFSTLKGIRFLTY